MPQLTSQKPVRKVPVGKLLDYGPLGPAGLWPRVRAWLQARPRLLLVLKVLWWSGILALIFILHDYPNREFRYWRL